MIDLYSFPTPNGRKVHLMLVECGLGFRAHSINIGKGEQFAPAFLRLSPNGRMPAIEDHDTPGGKPMSLFESGAILWYLAEKTGRFLPGEPRVGQAKHFRRYASEKIPYGVERYTNEVKRLLKVLEGRLGESPYLGSAEYTITDMATYPWVAHIAARPAPGTKS